MDDRRDIVAEHERLLSNFMWATECQLATLEGVAMLKRSSKSEMRRQFDIAARMVMVCRDKTSIEASDCKRNPRLKKLLLAKDGHAKLCEMFEECSVHGDYHPAKDRRY